MEGFYSTSVCAKSAFWISGFAPKHVSKYLKLHSPRLLAAAAAAAAASSLEEETATYMLPVSGPTLTSNALQYLLEKYNMDPKDTKLLLSFNNRADCGNSVMNDHSNNANIADV